MNKKTQRKKTGSYILAKALVDYGAEYVFGYTGGAIMPFIDELSDVKDIKIVKVRNEQGAAFAAGGYARASGKLGFVMTTSGPGATNTLTGVADCMMDSVPIMVITGQVATGVVGTDAFQESDIVGMMLCTTKHAVQPTSTDELAQTFHELAEVAMQGRVGPVNLDVPRDVQLGSSKNVTYKQRKKERYFETETVTSEKLRAAADMINNSKRPVIFCGHGILLGNAGRQFVSFVEKGKLPFAYTLQGLSGAPTDHALSLGMLGMHGTVAANRAIYNSDLIVALGMRFDDRVTGKLDEYAKNARVIHVDIDDSEIDKNVKVDLSFNADVKQVLTKLTPIVKKQLRATWFTDITKNKQKWDSYITPILKKGTGPNGNLLIKTIMMHLSKLTKGRDNVVSDVGVHEMLVARYTIFKRFNTFFSSGGLGTMGFSLPNAIGVKFARPKERVWAVMGDGGFQMNVQELGTILEHKLDVKIVILNNSVLGMVRQWQDMFFNKRFVETDMTNPDFLKIAEAYNIPGRRIIQPSEIDEAFHWAMNMPGPTILEFVCDKDEKVFPMILPNASFDEMIETEESIL